MSQIVKLRRSSVSGQKPTNSNLQLGELALNTADGKVYMAKSGSLGPSVEELVSTNASNTGSINLLGNISASVFSGSASGLINVPFHISGSDISGTTYNKTFTKLQFDDSTGLNVNENTPGTAFISIGSHFKDIFVSGSPLLSATGSDSFEVIGVDGIGITTSITDTNGNGYIKELNINATSLSSSLNNRIDVITGSIDGLNNFTSSVVLTSQTGSMTVLSASYAVTAAFALNAGAGGGGGSAIGSYSSLEVTSAASTWSFAHNSGQQYPIFQVFDSNGLVVIPSQIRAIDEDLAEIIFPSPQTGRVIASLGGGNGTTQEFINSNLWTVNHNLGTDYPDVTVWDSNRNIIFPNRIESVNTNQIKVYFSVPITGHVSVSRGGHLLSGSANTIEGLISGSSQITNFGFATTGSNNFIGVEDISGSLNVTGSVNITGSINLNGQAIGTGKLDETTFNSYTSSINTTIKSKLDSDNVISGSIQVNITGTTGYSTFSSSIDNLVSSSIASLSSSIASTNSSDDNRLDALEGTTSSLNSYTSSNTTNIDAIHTATGSLNTYTSSNTTNISAIHTATSSLNTFTSSANGRLNSLESASGSIRNDFNTFTSSYTIVSGSLDSRLDVLEAYSSSQQVPTASFSERTLQIDVYCKNISGVQINKGQVVRVNGSVGDSPLIALADNSAELNSANTLGIATQNIPNDSFGMVITAGILVGVNTSGMTAGDLIYLGTNGSFTNIEPVAPTHTVRLGEVLRVQQNQGSILVRVDNLLELNEAHDVTYSNITHGDLLVRSGSIWKNSKSLEGNYTVTGSLTVTQNLTVLGSSSLIYVTSSQLAVSASTISVNVFEPAERFGGLKVYDSGSSSATASLLWDSLHNHWIYQNVSGSNYSGGMLLSGPRNTGSLGDEPTLINGRLAKSVGGDHLDNSIISETGTTITIAGDLVANSITGAFDYFGLINRPTLISGSSQINITGTTDYTTFSSSIATTTLNLSSSIDTLSSSIASIDNTQNGRLNSIEGITGSITSLNSFTSSINTTIKSKLDADGVISGSSQIIYSGLTGIPNNIVSGSEQLTGSYDTRYVLSGSITQTTWDNIASKPSGIVSGSEQLTGSYDARYVLSGSITQTTWDNIANKPSGITSGSSQIVDLGFLQTSSLNTYTSSNDGRVSSLESKTGSYATTGSNSFVGIENITGSLIVSNSLNVIGSQNVTGSLIVSSSLKVIGTQNINGNLSVTGSVVISGSLDLSNANVGSSRYLHTQANSSATWNITHNLGYSYPNVIVYDGSNNKVMLPADVTSIDQNTTQVTFATPEYGYALVSVGGISTGTADRYLHTQDAVTGSWIIDHNLGYKFPNIDVYDVNDEQLIPQKVKAVSVNRVQIDFATPTSGHVIISMGGQRTTSLFNQTGSYYNTQNNIGITGSLVVTGDVDASNFNTTSDKKLKTDLIRIEGALDKIEKLNGYTFNWLEEYSQDRTRQIGMIADEVHAVQPELTSERNLVLNGNEEVILLLDYSKVTALLIEAVKELSDKVTKLENKRKKK